MKFLVTFLFLSGVLFAASDEKPSIPAEKQYYQKYQSFADPLYSPWLCDETFLSIHGGYTDTYDKGAFDAGRYMQYILARQASSSYYGDFIECGVLTGKSLDIFASVLDKWDPYRYKTLYGIDSFEGMAEPSEKDIDVRTGKPFFSKGAAKGWKIDAVSNALSYHKCKIQLLKGWIPTAFSGLERKTFCFAHIDVALYQATLDSLNFLYKRMVKGGIMLFDDYGFPMCFGAKTAIDEFFKDKPEVIIPLFTGQAFVIKQ